LDCDPTQQLYEKLFKHWVQGKEEGLISARDAKEVMGFLTTPEQTKLDPQTVPVPSHIIALASRISTLLLKFIS